MSLSINYNFDLLIPASLSEKEQKEKVNRIWFDDFLIFSSV